MKRSRLAVMVGLAIAAVADVGLADSAKWRVYLHGEKEYELRQAFTGSGGSTWLLIGTRAKGHLGGPQDLELRRVDAAGRFSDAVPVPGRSETTPVGAAWGDTAVIALSTANGVEVARFGEKSPLPQGRKTIHAPDEDALASSIVVLSDGGVLIVGRSAGRPWMAKLDARMGEVWNRVIEDVPAIVIEDGIGGKDGSFALSGTGLEGEETHLWLASFDKDGTLKSQKTLKGLTSHIVVSGSGYVVIHDQREDNLDIWVRGFSAAFSQQFERRIATGLEETSFELRKNTGDGWVAAFGADRRPMLTAGRDDAIVWTHTEPALSKTWESLWNVGAPLVNGKSVIFPYTLLSVDDKGEQRQIIAVANVAIEE